MNIQAINHCLTTAINHLAEQEIEVAAEDMLESLNEEKAADKASFKKYGVKWRTTKKGRKVGITKRGKIAMGNPHMMGSIPKEKISRKAKSMMGDAFSKILGARKAKKKKVGKPASAGGQAKKSPADRLRDELSKAKKKMGSSFNAMLGQDLDQHGNLTEAKYYTAKTEPDQKFASGWIDAMEQIVRRDIEIVQRNMKKAVSGKGADYGKGYNAALSHFEGHDSRQVDKARNLGLVKAYANFHGQGSFEHPENSANTMLGQDLDGYDNLSE